MIHDIILRMYPDHDDLSILDIGSGTGALTKELECYGDSIGVDVSQEAIRFAKSRGVHDVRLGSASETGLQSNSCDIVLCLDVLEHLPDDSAGVSEIKRVLKPGGTAIIFVPAFMFLWGITDEQSHHFRRYRLSEIEATVRASGFTIQRKSYFNTLLFPPIALQRLLVRLLSISVTSEVSMGNAFTNELFYRIFSFERTLLRYVNFPFGVSAMLVVTKKK